ncbi:MAG: carbohydrate-binding domain-containing protein [Firmicutes bacterium]|nr:carbohydrate-binding domain-containing protein [Bacillota bacterium]
MKLRKKIISAIAAMSLAATLTGGFASAADSGITVIYDGQTVEFDVQPEITDDSVMVPMRAIFELFGAKVKWDGDTQTITAKKKSKTITMTIGSSDITKNDETYTYAASPMIEDGRTLVPIRAVGELLGLDVDWDADTNTVTITTPTDEDDDSWKENTGTIDLDTLETTGDGVSVEDNVITITEGGDFEVTGTLEDGQIVIDTEDKVKLRLSGMSLTNTTGSAIYVKNADKAYITLTEDTENVLTDGETYTSGDDNEKACITSRDNLEIKGNGSLTINANYNHGIDSSDSIEISNGNITINAKNDGIHANETLEISGGTLTVTAEGDGLQADEIVDITGGTLDITTTGAVASSSSESFGGMGGGQGGMGGRGSQMQPAEQSEAQTDTTDEEMQSMREEMQQQFEQMQTAESSEDADEDATSKGIKADWLLDISGGEITVNSTDHAIHCASDINIYGGTITLASESGKGISAHGDLVIDDGEITITKATEGIESKQTMTINGGDIDITASDDGLNAGGNSMDNMEERVRDTERFEQMQSEDGEDSTEQSSETTAPETSDGTANGDMMQQGGMGFGGGRGGMGGGQITQQGGMSEMQDGGDMSDMQSGEQMTPPDMTGDLADGDTQPSGGQGGGMQGGMGGNDSGEIDSDHHIQINGGNITITADSDGIDSNGSICIEGGTILVNAQASGAESAFDADGTILFNGGTIMGVSGPGLGETPSSYSAQNSIIAYTTSTVAAGSEITIENSDGDTIFEFTATKGGTVIMFSSDELETGETYTVYAGGEEVGSAEIQDVVTTIGSAQSSRGGGQDGGMGGGQGGGRGGMGTDMSGGAGQAQ